MEQNLSTLAANTRIKDSRKIGTQKAKFVFLSK